MARAWIRAIPPQRLEVLVQVHPVRRRRPQKANIYTSTTPSRRNNGPRPYRSVTAAWVLWSMAEQLPSCYSSTRTQFGMADRKIALTAMLTGTCPCFGSSFVRVGMPRPRSSSGRLSLRRRRVCGTTNHWEIAISSSATKILLDIEVRVPVKGVAKTVSLTALLTYMLTRVAGSVASDLRD